MSTSPADRRAMSSADWGALISAFVGAFLLSLGLSGDSPLLKTGLVVVGVVLLITAIALVVRTLLHRNAEIADRERWDAFERSLDGGVRFDIPEGMGYAPELPVLLNDMADSGEPSDGQAKNAIVGERGDIHWCAFQHQRPGGTSTVGMIGLRPDREADSYPRLRVTVQDPAGATFDERFDIMCAEAGFPERVLTDDVRRELMTAVPFSWRLEGNQLITTLDEPSNPEQQVAFIEDRVEPLARVAALIPLDA